MERSECSRGNNTQLTTPKLVLCIKSQDGREIHYRYSRDRTMGSLFSLYCKENNIERKGVVFLHNERLIKSRTTPWELGLEDDDVIDVMMHQSGG